MPFKYRKIKLRTESIRRVFADNHRSFKLRLPSLRKDLCRRMLSRGSASATDVENIQVPLRLTSDLFDSLKHRERSLILTRNTAEWWNTSSHYTIFVLLRTIVAGENKHWHCQADVKSCINSLQGRRLVVVHQKFRYAERHKLNKNPS